MIGHCLVAKPICFSLQKMRFGCDDDLTGVNQLFGYDNLDRQVSVMTAVDDVELALMTTDYSENGCIASVDFEDVADEEVEYEYDSNGNLVADLNRGVAGIVYSSLNQPLRIEFADGKSMENIYDADGLLLQRCLVNAKMVAGGVTYSLL